MPQQSTCPDALVMVPAGDTTTWQRGILTGSALICRAGDVARARATGEKALVQVAFEGNAIGAINMERFHEKCMVAAGRLATRAPSIAYASLPVTDLHPVARFDLARMVFTEILDRAALEAWAGEPVDSFLPPASLETPAHAPDTIRPLTDLPMRARARGQNGLWAWELMDGTFLAQDLHRGGPLTAWRPGDAGLDALLERAGLDAASPAS